MADTKEIVNSSFPSKAKEYIQHNQTTLETIDTDDVYILRTLIDKVNELTRELNIIKSALGG